ncbi:substrate-binding domain-containing protein [Phycisphaeraceae bacterium D3-23]
MIQKTAPTRRRSVLLALAWYDHRAHRGATRYALEHGWHLDATMANAQELAWGWRGDGVLCKLGCTKRRDDLIRFVGELDLPAIDLSVFGTAAGLPSIEFDPVAIAQDAADHLLERGLRHFAWYPSQPDPPVRLREDALRNVLAQSGFDLHPLAPEATDGEEASWQDAARRLGERLSALPKPLGVVAFSDEFGLRVLEACARAGLRVPEDIAVLGINNNTLVCESLAVPLSSVVLDMEQWAYAACAMLDRLMDGEAVEMQRVAFPAQGVAARRSTDVIAVDHVDVKTAVRFIAKNYRKPIGVDDVVAATRMTRSGLKRAFKTHLRRSIRDEVQRVRTHHIKRLLTETDWTIETIAGQVGLRGARQLYQTFERTETVTPRQYRLRHRQTGDAGVAAG